MLTAAEANEKLREGIEEVGVTMKQLLESKVYMNRQFDGPLQVTPVVSLIDYKQLWNHFKAIEGGYTVSLGNDTVIRLDALMVAFEAFMNNPKATKVLPHEVKL